ncbi:ABC-2 type transport system permease protein [Pseudobutyrivibrio sp. 49]|uniref:GldG family protein n=1 Tax=unclassified Pseudobutyrivibrio TaxID=2638619 RepID=UPI00087EDDD8|nr:MULTISPECIES: GldG family protein [unclassified Pseudobutyrivibrio]SDH28892.1 ABC-2 type transport system permease protein [Pseudobutyrivibrio sp. 49]SFN52714.1 ABC-2 type transport system permease protein [Pseudobutyrivibrio sp. UC1225]
MKLQKPNIDIKAFQERTKESLNTKRFKIGSYSKAITILVLGIVIAINVFVSSLPSKFTQFDISAARLYSLTSSSKAVVSNIEDDVTIYWICQAGQESTVIEKLLNVYDSLSDNLKVVKKDPDTYPTFAKEYTDETVTNNSLIVVSGDKSRYISYESMYQVDNSSYYTTGSASQSFDGESLITTAIDYVVSEELPQAYVLTGHGEAEMGTTMKSALEKSNVETKEFSLLNVDSVPEDASIILINSPTSDLSEEEVTILESYMDNGGHIVVLSGPEQDAELANFKSLLEYVGVSVTDGIVIDTNRDNYAFEYPYFLMPTIGASDITNSLVEGNSKVIMPISAGLTINNTAGAYTVTSLLDSSSESYAKTAGYSLSTYDKEEGDVDGPFSLAISAENSSEGSLVWIASDYLLDDQYNSYSSGANTDFFMNAISWKMTDNESLQIRAKSLDYNYLTISASAARMIKIIMIGLIPLGYLLYGIDEVVRRRKVSLE